MSVLFAQEQEKDGVANGKPGSSPGKPLASEELQGSAWATVRNADRDLKSRYCRCVGRAQK